MSHKELKGKALDGCCEFEGKKLTQPGYCNHSCHQSSKERNFLGISTDETFEERLASNERMKFAPKDPSTWAERFDKFLLGDFVNGLHVPRTRDEWLVFFNKELEQARDEALHQGGVMGFEAGKSQALQEVVGLLEGMKENVPLRWLPVAWVEILSDVKEAIVKLMV